MGRLDVRIVEARNLPNTELIGKPDPYVKVEIENNMHKTSVAAGTVNPKWDEVFKFVVADPDSAQLSLKLFDKNMVSDKYMGEYKMSLSGLTKGGVKDTWVLLQQCKTNAEIHIRLLAHDFGHEAAPGQAPAQTTPPPVHQSPPVMQQQQPVYQQPMMQQQPVYQQPMVQQQPMYQQPVMMQQPMMQQPMMGQPGYPPQQYPPQGQFRPPQQMGAYPGQYPQQYQQPQYPQQGGYPQPGQAYNPAAYPGQPGYRY